jgi:hypothetical protein
MSNDKWDKSKHGVDQESAERAEHGINKSGSENLAEAWKNIKEVFSPGSKANTTKENKKSTTGNYPGR